MKLLATNTEAKPFAIMHEIGGSGEIRCPPPPTAKFAIKAGNKQQKINTTGYYLRIFPTAQDRAGKPFHAVWRPLALRDCPCTSARTGRFRLEIGGPSA
ncbi:hypothetical protein [Jhaorihella thermophila]|uniref:hypothetical protein n=1 Tax=Jhaorihella thermophila TaxID=488547 RepID=UPI003620DC86